MKNFQSKFYIDVNRHLQAFCHSIAHRGVTNFTHDITFGHNEISMLMTDQEMFRFYVDNKIPVVCMNDSGRTLSNGIYTNKILENKHNECLIYMKLFRKKAHDFGLNYGKNSLHYAFNEDDCQHLYSIFFDESDDDFLYFVINNGTLIHDMINQYNYFARDIILEAKAIENRIILPSAYDLVLSPNQTQASIHSKQLCVIHKNSNLPLHLPSQRSQCLLHLLQGKSIKVIAQDMGLSSKTIEHYLGMLRKELGCRSSKELIAYYANQLI